MKIKSKLIKLVSYGKFLLTSVKRKSQHKTVYIEMTKVTSSRRLISLVRYFSENGYQCLVHISFRRFIHVYLSELYVFWEKSVKFSQSFCAGRADMILTDRPGKFKGKGRVVSLDYDVFNKRRDYSDGYFFPISFYPSFLNRESERLALSKSGNGNRAIKVLFAGTIDRSYTNERTKEYFGINTRAEIFDYIQQHMSSDQVYIPRTYRDMQDKMKKRELVDKVVLLNASDVAIPPEDYFSVLHQTDYFIHMSGYIQPFCHNQIETMACGVIPITQFPDIFHPNLEEGIHARIFKTLPDLHALLEKILTEKSVAMDTIRANVVSYYKDYFSYDSFEKRITTTGTLYICAGKDSIL